MREQTDLRLALHVPASSAERHAHGLANEICTLLVQVPEDGRAIQRLAAAADQLLPEGDTTFVAVFGDFGRGEPALPSVLAPLPLVPGLNVFRLEQPENLAALFRADVEALGLARGSDTRLRELLNVCAGSPDRWWMLSRESAAGRFANLSRTVGNVVVFAPSEMSLEVFGSESSLKAAVQNLASM